MKLIAMLLSFCLSMNVMATTLEEAFDNYQYSLTVEWDQKDLDAKSVYTSQLFQEIDGLISRGLTQAEILTFVKNKVSNENQFEHISKELSALAGQSTSATELIGVLNNHSSDLYSRGASWEATEPVVTGIVIAISAIFAYSVYFAVRYGCVETSNGVKTYCTDDKPIPESPQF